MRSAVIVLAGVGLVFASLPAAAQSTTRIETRPFYGATVTVEEGVRVFRPLPPHDRVIINPDAQGTSLAPASPTLAPAIGPTCTISATRQAPAGTSAGSGSRSPAAVTR